MLTGRGGSDQGFRLVPPQDFRSRIAAKGTKPVFWGFMSKQRLRF
jgi:hypothetical protein